MTNVEIDIGRNLKAARIFAGMTQNELAEKAGVKQKQISTWEAGKVTPTPCMLAKLAECLCITIDCLMGIPQMSTNDFFREVQLELGDYSLDAEKAAPKAIKRLYRYIKETRDAGISFTDPVEFVEIFPTTLNNTNNTNLTNLRPLGDELEIAAAVRSIKSSNSVKNELFARMTREHCIIICKALMVLHEYVIFPSIDLLGESWDYMQIINKWNNQHADEQRIYVHHED